MIHRFHLVGLAVALALLTPRARAMPIVYLAELSGPGESPPNMSPGTGEAEVIVDLEAHTLSVHVSFSNLLGTTTASHIHSRTDTPGAGTAGVATTTPTFPGLPLGVTSGTYDQTFNMTLASSYNPAFVSANGGTPTSAELALAAGIAAGEAYLNIHTTVVPGGEIRGFLEPAVPEPSTLVLATIGGLCLIAVGSRTRTRTRVRAA